ncbi:MMPL family transporter [Paenibacillus sp. JX-17]|uniref:MMPL family transporter n=1 Tax=Paenibacillus lacisoli TaxID=3064525 RepID=A0ABT9CAK7_9BACL|nr:MMPL family transporter [Paenibacillus sp. JX-17]MDO7905905.1 MMPL family transporter [Paenibacillus sp. JX-17]
MRTILKARWGIMALWIVVAVVLMLTAPAMSNLVREKGQTSVPEGYSSTRAAAILDEVAKAEGKKEGSTVALVFYNGNGLTTADKEEAKKAVQSLEGKKESLGIESILDPFSQPELKDKMISENGKTILTSVTILKGDRSVKEMRTDLDQALGDIKVEHYLTGQQLIEEDTVASSEAGLKKSEYITVAFILIILFVVFRSFVAPFVPLLTVGISYIVSQQIVAFLVDRFDFPLSNFTQIFMVAVMFGIGTDYCILLISRFKEELSRREDTWEAIIETYRTAGKTVFFSSLAVLVGFVAIGFSQFILYRSAVAVAVGIAVMVVALLTIVPFFMAVLGKKLFWPARGSLEHKESRTWGAAGAFSFKRPVIALVIVAVITVPFLVTYDGKLSFNSLDEIGDNYDSVKAFNLISDNFGPGESLPGKIVIKNDEKMDNSQYMGLAEKISREVAKVDGVASVRSMTRPTGTGIEDFKVSQQAEQLSKGLGEGTDGLDQIASGLYQASSQLSANTPKLNEAAESAGKLTAGTTELQNGVTQLGSGLEQIEKGIRSGASGAGELRKGLQQAKDSASQLAAANQKLLAAYQQIGKGLNALGPAVGQVQQQLNGAAGALTKLDGSFTNLEGRYPGLAEDRDYATIKGTVTQTGQGLTQLAGGLKQMQSQVNQAASGMAQANAGYAKAAAGQQQLTAGLQQIVNGIGSLEKGLEQAASGQGQIVDKIPAIEQGLGQLAGGQRQIQEGFGQLSGQISQLTTGLNKSVNGLKKVSDGIGSAQDYLNGLQSSSDSELGGFYVPQEALDNKDFQKVFDNYLSADRKVMTMDVVFDYNPYSTEAMDQVPAIQAAVERAVKGTALEQADIAISGVTSTFSDLQNISNKDYTKTVALMLLGTFIVLVLLLRSIVMPLYLILSLVLTYFTAMGVTEWLFVDLMGYSGITWVTPFFGFVMLIALGVDYSIFLMDRFNENKEWDTKDALIHAMKNMGGVILSAAIILSGTFAAMYPSGVLSMMQIATVVLSGLVLYALLFLPFFIPVMVRTFGRANWWPFTPRSDSQQQNHDSTFKA